MKSGARIGIYLRPFELERLDEMCSRQQVTRNTLLTAVVTVLSDDEIKEIIARFDAVEKIEVEMQQRARLETLRAIRGKTATELAQVLRATQAAKASP